MLSVQDKCLLMLGITGFHEAGYTGSRVKIMSDEKVVQKDFPNIIAPTGFSKERSCHGNDVMKYIAMVAPNATLISYPMSGSFGTNYKSSCIDYIKNEKVHVFTTSCLGSQLSVGKKKAMQDCIDLVNTVFFASAGNDNTKGIHGESKGETYLAIGGVKYIDGTTVDKLQKISYSSIGKELDYMTIAEIPVRDDLSSGGVGTSFCAPVFAAMVGLVQDFFIDKTGKPLSYAKVIEFINDNCVDLNTKGFDIYTGHGIFILPNPMTIDIKKYCPDYVVNDITPIEPTLKPEEPKQDNKDEIVVPELETTNLIELTIDDKVMIVNGKKIVMDVAPFIKQSRTFVPVRFITEALEKEVIWDGTNRKIIIK